MDHIVALQQIISTDLSYNYGMYYLWMGTRACVLTTIVIYNHGVESIFYNCMSTDSLFTSVEFIMRVLTGQQITIYKLSIIQRYIYYLLIAGIDIVMYYLFWGKFYAAWHILMCLMTAPSCLNWLSQTVFVNIALKYITEKINKIKQYIMCNIAARLITAVCKQCLNAKVYIHHLDIHDDTKHIDTAAVVNFTKSIVAATIIHFIEQSNSGIRMFIPWVIDAVCKYGAILDVPAVAFDEQIMDVNSARARITTIIRSRKWVMLYNPRVLNDIIEIYKTSPDGTLHIQVRAVIHRIEVSILKIATACSCASIFNMPLLAPVLSLVMLGGRLRSDRAVAPRIAGILVGAMYGSEVVMAICCELFEYIDNPAIIWLASRTADYINKHKYKITNYNKYNSTLIISVLCCTTLQFNPAHALLMSMGFTNKVIIALFITLGYISSYHPAHILFIAVVIYIAVNLAHISQARAKKIEFNVISDYTTW